MSRELEDVLKLLKRAGEEILKIYQKSYPIYEKKDKSPVTEADLASEKLILQGLEKYHWPVLSEETEDDFSRLRAERVWIVDSLDGTADFLQKTGEFAIMVGLVHQKEPILGVVYKPVGDKLYFAEKGKGAYLKESGQPSQKLKVSRVAELSEAKFVASRNHFEELEKKFMEDNKIAKVNHLGSTGIKMGLIAEGKAEAYLNISTKTYQWDTCAPEIILKEAGGEVTDLTGESFSYNRQEVRNLKGVIASNKKIHQQIVEKITQMPK